MALTNKDKRYLQRGVKWCYIGNDLTICKKKTCCICKGPIEPQRTPDGKVFWADGHNAEPIAEGSCCDICNAEQVIPARMEAIE